MITTDYYRKFIEKTAGLVKAGVTVNISPVPHAYSSIDAVFWSPSFRTRVPSMARRLSTAGDAMELTVSMKCVAPGES